MAPALNSGSKELVFGRDADAFVGCGGGALFGAMGEIAADSGAGAAGFTRCARSGGCVSTTGLPTLGGGSVPGVGEGAGAGATDVVRTVGLSTEIGLAANTGDVSFTTDDALNGSAGMTVHVARGFFKVGDVSFTTDDALNGSAGMTVHVGVGSKVGGVKFTVVITIGRGASLICDSSFVHGKRFVSTSAAIARRTEHDDLVTALAEW